MYVYPQLACSSPEPVVDGRYVSFGLGHSCRHACKRPYDCLCSFSLYSMDGIRRYCFARMHPDVGGIVHHRYYHGCEKLPRCRGSHSLQSFQFHRSLKALGRCPCNVLLVVKSRVHDDTQDLDLILRRDSLTLNGEWFRVYPACVPGEMYDRRLFCLKSRTAPSLPVESFVNDRLYPSPVTQGCRPRHPRGVVVDKRDGPTIPIDLSLHWICI